VKGGGQVKKKKGFRKGYPFLRARGGVKGGGDQELVEKKKDVGTPCGRAQYGSVEGIEYHNSGAVVTGQGKGARH